VTSKPQTCVLLQPPLHLTHFVGNIILESPRCLTCVLSTQFRKKYTFAVTRGVKYKYCDKDLSYTVMETYHKEPNFAKREYMEILGVPDIIFELSSIHARRIGYK
jgi:hypothetical protein